MGFDLRRLLGIDDPQPQPRPQAKMGNQAPLPVRNSAAPQLGNNTQAARAYAKNPMASNADPAAFGYPAENPRLQVNRFVDSGLAQNPNLGVGFMGVQGNPENPGNIPLQSAAPGRFAFNPQVKAFNTPLRQQYTPQVEEDGYYYNN